MEENNNVVEEIDGKNVVFIRDIRFKGRQNIEWEEVEQYLKKYIKTHYEVLETSDVIYIGVNFPEELKGSLDTQKLYGGNAKGKANATQEIPLLLKYATNKRWKENFGAKHNADAKYGWYRYTSRFALPIYNNDNELVKYNIYRIEMLVRHASDNKKYLYDMVNIKKEKETKYPT